MLPRATSGTCPRLVGAKRAPRSDFRITCVFVEDSWCPEPSSPSLPSNSVGGNEGTTGRHGEAREKGYSETKRRLSQSDDFTNAFTEVDFPRSPGAVSGRFRTGARVVLVGSVLLTCRCLAVVRVLGPAGAGAPSGPFRWISGNFRSRKAPLPRSGCLLGWYWRSRARCGKEISTAFLFDANFET